MGLETVGGARDHQGEEAATGGRMTYKPSIT